MGSAWVSKRTGCCHSVGAPLHGVLLAGLGSGVGDCRGAVVTEDDVLFGSLVEVSGRNISFLVCKLLHKPVTTGEPTPVTLMYIQ